MPVDAFAQLKKKNLFFEEEGWVQRAISKFKRNNFKMPHRLTGTLSPTTAKPTPEAAFEDTPTLSPQSDTIQASGGIEPSLTLTSSLARSRTNSTGSPFNPTDAAAMAAGFKNLNMMRNPDRTYQLSSITTTNESNNMEIDQGLTASRADSVEEPFSQDAVTATFTNVLGIPDFTNQPIEKNAVWPEKDRDNDEDRMAEPQLLMAEGVSRAGPVRSVGFYDAGSSTMTFTG
ncbi:MAG TPA: hypothetical protein VGO47_05545 [Chlamydiales bacterium]|nr:hypothetical protein [Chlamydiales bacterium]